LIAAENRYYRKKTDYLQCFHTLTNCRFFLEWV
jgi:hypothetical protein